MNGSEFSGKRKTARRITAVVLLFLIAGAMYLSPSFIHALFEREGYSEWMQINAEPRVLIINVWHIVGFKPFIGSLGAWLESRADEYKSRYIGVYFDVKSLTEEQARQLMNRGMLPDIVSFAGGTYSPELLLAIDKNSVMHDGYSVESGMCGDILYALPYCASGMLLLYDPNTSEGLSKEEMIERAGSSEEFKRGKVSSCICGIKEAGDLYRAELAGKAPYFEAEPYKTADQTPELVQYVGIRRETDHIKLKYALEFISFITDKDNQSSLGELGLLPVNTLSAPVFEHDWLGRLYALFDPYKLRGCFDTEG